MKKHTQHFETCSAPSCVDCWDENTVWVAGEEVCSRTPLSELQKKQRRINREIEKGNKKLIGKSWTVGELLKTSL